AAVALLIWTVAYLVQGPRGASERWSFQSRLFVLALAGAAIMYGLFFAFLRIEGMISKPQVINGKEVVYNGKEIKVSEFTPRQVWLLTVGGACALLAVLIPLLAGLGRLRFRRIWAIARLSIKETVRQRILWIFSALL